MGGMQKARGRNNLHQPACNLHAFDPHAETRMRQAGSPVEHAEPGVDGGNGQLQHALDHARPVRLAQRHVGVLWCGSDVGGGEWWGSAGLASCIRADETAGPRLFGTGGSGLVDRILRPFHTADLCNMHRQLTSTVGVTYCWMMKRKRPKKMASSVMRRNSQRLRMRWVRGKLTWGRGSGGRVLM